MQGLRKGNIPVFNNEENTFLKETFIFVVHFSVLVLGLITISFSQF